MSKDIEEILKKIGREDVPTEAHKIAEETSENFSKNLTPSRPHILWEHIMKSKITKLAAAAVIIIVAVVGIHQIGGSGVALADVLERVEQAQAFMYRTKMTITGAMAPGMPAGEKEMDSTITVSNDYGMKMEMTMTDANTGQEEMTQQMYVVPDQKVMIMLMPEQKKYLRMEFDDEWLARIKKENNDPRETIKQIMSCEYTELGRSVIDGIEVQGFQTTDPAFYGGAMGEEGDVKVELWVDVESRLPVRAEMDFRMNEQMQMHGVLYDYQWDVPVDASEFQPVIPEDFTEFIEGGMKMPPINEETAIEGLKFFAEMSGQYPKKLNLMNLMQEFAAIEKTPTDTALKIKEEMNRITEDEQMKMTMEMMRPVQSLGMFYMTLVKEKKDPAYYGDEVTAEFPHAVLMRWKISEDQYRVIFGDLTTEDVSPDRLAELESMPLNLEPYAIKPQPADGTVGTPITEMELSWMPGAYVTEHKVYFGTNADSLSPLAEVPYSSLILAPALQRQMSYYWRVDEVQPDGSVVTGDVWSFNTGRMVAWWMLDDASGDIATDVSDNGHDGKLVDNTSWVPGIIGGALQFDGDGDYVDIGNDPDLNITSQITVSAWIKVDAFDRDWQAIVTKGDSAWRLQRGRSNNHLEFACSGLAVPGTSWGNIFGTIDVNDGQWHHAVGVYDWQKLYLYLDGTLDASADASGTIRINEEPVYIGENSERPERCWNGLIDDVRIYSYALSADEIAAIYEAAIEAK